MLEKLGNYLADLHDQNRYKVDHSFILGIVLKGIDDLSVDAFDIEWSTLNVDELDVNPLMHKSKSLKRTMYNKYVNLSDKRIKC